MREKMLWVIADFIREHKMALLRLIVIIVCSCTITSLSYASDINTTQVGRYLVEKNGAQLSQVNPLQQIFSITFPSDIYQVKQAVSYLLINSGYNLAPNAQQTSEANYLLNQKLPLSDRQMGPMTIEEALLALAGDKYQLLIDPEKRFVSFKLKKPFENLYL